MQKIYDIMCAMQKCDRCGKGVLIGMNVSHSHIRTKKRSYPNIHAYRIKIDSVSKKLHLCTKCLRIVKSQLAEKLNKNKQQKENLSGLYSFSFVRKINPKRNITNSKKSRFKCPPLPTS